MSGGRIEVGVGAGWNELEHRQLGLPFPPIKERADLMEDQLAILHGLWGEPDGWSYDGHQVSIRDAQFHPKPVDVPGRPRTPIGGARPRLLVGGGGSPRSLRLAARYADEFNLSSSGPDEAREVFAAARRGVRGDRARPGDARPLDDGRRADRPRRGRDGRTAVDARRHGRLRRRASEEWLDERRDRWITGTPDEAREQVRQFAAAGVERLMLQDFLPWDLDMIDVMGEALVGQL